MGHSGIMVLSSLVLLLPFLSVVHADYCTNSLAKKTCPSLATVDSLDLSAYSGTWYEIGSTANFKNTLEAGGTCAVAKYSSSDKENELKVENSHYLSAKAGTVVAVGGISGSCSLVCQSARAVCSQVNIGDSLLREGISKVWKLKNSIEGSYSSEAGSVSSANAKIEAAANEIAPKVDTLAKYVSQIQSSNSILSQTDGSADASSTVGSMKATITLASEQVKSLDASFKVMSDAQLELINVAATLFKKGGDGIGPSFTLTDAATQVLGGLTSIKAQVTAMTAAFEVSSKAASAVLEDKTKAYYNISKAMGKAVRNGSSGGKLSVSFDPVSEKLFPGKYWILAVNGEGTKYNAALVYSCMEVLTGGTEETMWILSRSPELDDATTNALLSKATSMGVDQDCNAPFVRTVRTSKCPA
ncbi:apolipoprotein D and lipocalin family protein [Marchantia polymorpha subsp. ruderalis]|nr:hypothetical protein MARPO_0050s0013 [Marchantia polymorpha]BBN05316.1 hypothetical protein Mp_3g12080 [Marchantia polymorpha subsp. ruderalis]|eukprot:PTQ38537.1 hypothetical protein MARPO_0050s0013 [Marchantia polymorpha]